MPQVLFLKPIRRVLTMSDTSSDCESKTESMWSESDFIFQDEREDSENPSAPSSPSILASLGQPIVDDVDEGAYLDEPIASSDWVEEYTERQDKKSELENEMSKRLSKEISLSEWCKCGNCSTDNLQNINECYCCAELEGCLESLTTEWVTQDVGEETQLSCVTEHPGFRPVCLEKWNLRMASKRIKTKEKKQYRQTGSESRFLRSVAYREFCRLVYGFLGSKRIPLPACAYTAIRKTFPLDTDEAEHFTGFVLDEDCE